MAEVAKYLLHTKAKFSQYRARIHFLNSIAFFTQKWGRGEYLTIGVNIKIIASLDSIAFFIQKMKGCLTIGVNIEILPNLDSIAFITEKRMGA